MRSRLTYANVTATLALFLALGGVSWAAATLPKNSVGTKQLKANAVTSAKVARGTLQRSDFDASALPADGATGARGPQGATGPGGPTGPTGPAGPAGANADAFDIADWADGALPANHTMQLTIDGVLVMTGTTFRTDCRTAGPCRIALGGQIPVSLEASGWFQQALTSPAAARKSFSLTLLNNGTPIRRFFVAGGIPIALQHQSDDFQLVWSVQTLQQVAV